MKVPKLEFLTIFHSLTILQYNLWAIPAGRFLMSGGIFGWMISVGDTRSECFLNTFTKLSPTLQLIWAYSRNHPLEISEQLSVISYHGL
jgi:hypothetical protein